MPRRSLDEHGGTRRTGKTGYQDRGDVAALANGGLHRRSHRLAEHGGLAALHARAETGRGQSIDVSLGGQIWAQATEYTHYLLTSEAAGRANLGHPLIEALYGLFETADGGSASSACRRKRGMVSCLRIGQRTAPV